MHPGSSMAAGIDAVAVVSTHPGPRATAISGPLLPGGSGAVSPQVRARYDLRRWRGTHTRGASSAGGWRTIEVPSPGGARQRGRPARRLRAIREWAAAMRSPKAQPPVRAHPVGRHLFDRLLDQGLPSASLDRSTAGRSADGTHPRLPASMSIDTCHNRAAFSGSMAYSATSRRMPGCRSSASLQSSK